MSPSPKSNFKNTDFIDVAPVVRTSKGPVTMSDQEEMVAVKVEAGASFEFDGNEQIVVSSEHLGKEEYQHAEWESEAASYLIIVIFGTPPYFLGLKKVQKKVLTSKQRDKNFQVRLEKTKGGRKVRGWGRGSINTNEEWKWLKLLTLLVSVALTDAVKATDTNWASIITCLCL